VVQLTFGIIFFLTLAMATVQELVAVGEKMGLKADALQNFVREHQALIRDERQKEREKQETKPAFEKEKFEKLEKQRAFEKEKFEQELELQKRKSEVEYELALEREKMKQNEIRVEIKRAGEIGSC
jgi:hypothetical protein